MTDAALLFPPAEAADPPERVAGLRVLRVLHEGERCTVMLCTVDGTDDAEPARLVVKLYRPDADPAAVTREAAVALAGPHQHLAGLRDAAALAASQGTVRALVLEAIAGPTLAELVESRRRLRPGEAVTTVIGVVRAVAAVHATGCCGVQLSGDDVRFTTDGRPVLTGLGRLRELLAAGAAGVGDDWRAVAALAARLGLMPPSGRARSRWAGPASPLAQALAALAAHETGSALERVEDELFDVAEPLAVTLGAGTDAERVAGAGDPALSAEHTSARAAPTPRRRDAAHRRPTASVLIEALDRGPGQLMAAPLAAARERAKTALDRLRGRTRLVAAATAIALLGATAALLLLPSGHRSGAPEAAAAPPSAAAPRLRATSGATSVPPRSATASAPAAMGTAAAEDAAALHGDDPVRAAVVLLRLRDACLAGAPAERVACLAPLTDTDAADLLASSRLLAGLRPSLIERTGDSALVALAPAPGTQTPPASVLLMRTEAGGWKLRQFYEN